MRKESGLDIKDPQLCGLLMFPAYKGDDWYVFVFKAQIFNWELQENDEGYLKWIPDAELESRMLWPSDHIFSP